MWRLQRAGVHLALGVINLLVGSGTRMYLVPLSGIFTMYWVFAWLTEKEGNDLS